MQIGQWFLEKRADDADNFPELPSEEEGGSKAIPDPLMGGATPPGDGKATQKKGAELNKTGKGMGATAKGLRLFLPALCCPFPFPHDHRDFWDSPPPGGGGPRDASTHVKDPMSHIQMSAVNLWMSITSS